MSETSISITVNGGARKWRKDGTIAQLLAELDTAGKRIAVERNGNIVPKSLHAATDLVDGDRLEIVIAVGGG